MQVHIQLRIFADDDTVIRDDEVLWLDKGNDRLEELGLSLAEAKTLLERLQQGVIEAQAASYLHRHRDCSVCGRSFRHKGRSATVFRTTFGTVHLSSPRFHRCGCRPGNRKTFSPLTELFTEHTAPELLHLETKWASLVSYGMTADLLKDVLPLGATLNGSTVRRHLHKVAARHDAELGDERTSFITGCPADWRDLPAPEGLIVVGIDGSMKNRGRLIMLPTGPGPGCRWWPRLGHGKLSRREMPSDYQPIMRRTTLQPPTVFHAPLSHLFQHAISSISPSSRSEVFGECLAVPLADETQRGFPRPWPNPIEHVQAPVQRPDREWDQRIHLLIDASRPGRPTRKESLLRLVYLADQKLLSEAEKSALADALWSSAMARRRRCRPTPGFYPMHW